MIPKRIILVTAFIIVLTLAFVFVYSAKNELDFSETMVLAQFCFTILAFSAVMYTLYYASAQFRKSMAKPSIKVTFSKDGSTETTLDLLKDRNNQKELEIWVNNNGNAVADRFQVDIKVPKLLNQSHVVAATKTDFIIGTQEEKTSYSYLNDSDDPLFVNSPKNINHLPIESSHSDYNSYPEKLDINYIVYGDWAETQEGTLTIIINKP